MAAKKKARPKKRNSIDAKYWVDLQVRTLRSQWGEVLRRLNFQLPVQDSEGLPGNIHLMGTLRDAQALLLRVDMVLALRQRMEG